MSAPTLPEILPSTGMVVIATGMEHDGSWSFRCPSCWSPHRCPPVVGYREKRCQCDGWPYAGFVVAAPEAELAPYPDMCPHCVRHAASAPCTPVDLRVGDFDFLVAVYQCNFIARHSWQTTWNDRVRLPRPSFQPGVSTALYRHYDHADVLLYAGITNDLVARGKSHTQSSRWAEYVHRSEAVWFDSRPEAEYEERQAIQIEEPVFNVAHSLFTPEEREERVAKYLSRYPFTTVDF